MRSILEFIGCGKKMTELKYRTYTCNYCRKSDKNDQLDCIYQVDDRSPYIPERCPMGYSSFDWKEKTVQKSKKVSK